MKRLAIFAHYDDRREVKRHVVHHMAETATVSAAHGGPPAGVDEVRGGPPPNADNVCALVITHEPDRELSARLAKVLAQMGRVIVVDDGSVHQMATLDALGVDPRVEVLRLGENRGIAAALNRGFERARERGFEWVVTLDQDARVYDDLLTTLLGVYADCPFRDALAVIGANFDESSTGTTGTAGIRATTAPWVEVGEVITSGSLQSVQAFTRIGPFRDDFFMYFVDNEYCRRAGRSGYRVVIATKPVMLHQTGRAKRWRLPFGEVVVYNYAPWRHYYIVRNGIVMVRENFRRDLGWSARAVRNLAKRTLYAVALEDHKLEKMKLVARAIRDGVAGKTGKLER
jgi:rhamnosyltransferase